MSFQNHHPNSGSVNPSPFDLPDSILIQIANRVQHRLLAHLEPAGATRHQETFKFLLRFSEGETEDAARRSQLRVRFPRHMTRSEQRRQR